MKERDGLPGKDRQPIPVVPQTEFAIIGPVGQVLTTVRVRELQEQIDSNSEDNDKPKPPKRPNARIGRTALGNI